MAFRRLPLLLAPLLLGGCVKIFVIGHTDDWADYITGTGSADPLGGQGHAEIHFAKLDITCSGTFRDYARGRARGETRCDDGRIIKTESWVLSMSHGKGTGIDQLGHKGEFDFYTDEASYERELAATRAEVERRNLDIAHLREMKVPGAVADSSAPAAATIPVPQSFAAKKSALASMAPAALPAPATAPVAVPAPAPTADPVPKDTKPPIPGSGRRLALVIGNGAYREAPLKNPVNDARALANRLRSLGFDVLSGENLSLRDMTRLVTRFGERLAGYDVGLFFFAGHGMQVRGKNYLIPVDAQIGTEASVRAETVDVDAILDQLSASPLNIVLLDACRNNPFERRFRAVSGGLAQMDAPKGTLIAYATAPGKVAMDGDGANSTYTTALLRALGEPGLPVESVFKRVRMEVARVTSDAQVPWESSSLTGDFYFAAPAVPAAAPAPPPAPQHEANGETEILFWQSIKDSQDVEDFNAYLKRYPDGRFADIARNRIARMKSGK